MSVSGVVTPAVPAAQLADCLRAGVSSLEQVNPVGEFFGCVGGVC
jgi:hypothetical protein